MIQGRNDPRVVAEESEDLVEHLREIGKNVDLLLFENEGHGVEKYENKVLCYNRITEFFIQLLKPVSYTHLSWVKGRSAIMSAVSWQNWG